MQIIFLVLTATGMICLVDLVYNIELCMHIDKSLD